MFFSQDSIHRIIKTISIYCLIHLNPILIVNKPWTDHIATDYGVETLTSV